jgi:hypothetical protein
MIFRTLPAQKQTGYTFAVSAGIVADNSQFSGALIQQALQ